VTEVPRPGAGVTGWQSAIVTAIHPETATAATIRLRPMRALDHLPGQHLVVRLTAPDGYTASRSYSIATPPDPRGDVDITVERLPDGEVSGFLHDELIVGDKLEVRGPIGRFFTWVGEGPAVLVGGGSGVVPLMAMLRHARRTGAGEVRLLVSARSPADVYYADELPGPEVTVAYTRSAPPGHPRRPARLTVADVAPVVLPGSVAYVCGSSGFVDLAARLLVDAGHPSDRIRIERFGVSG
jgi:ferredoxin-NADP reductase